MAAWSLCLAPPGGVWETGLITGFGSFTPCLLSLVLTVSYAVLAGVGLWRLRTLCLSGKRVRLRASSLVPHLLLLLLAALCLVEPLLQLALGLSATDPDGGYPPGAEALALALAALANAAVLAVLVAETRLASPHLAWYLRFALLWSVVAQATRLQYFWQLRSFFNVRVVGLVVAGAAGQLALAVVRLFHFPGVQDVSGPYEKLSQEEEAGEGEGEGVGSGGDEGTYEELPGAERGSFPERGANVISWLLFGWMGPLMKLGFRRPIEEKDVWKLDEWDRTETLQRTFQRHWEAELRREKPWLLRALTKTLGLRFLLGGFCKIGNDAAQFVGPVFLSLLLQSMQNGEPPMKSYIYVVCIFVGALLGVISEAQYFQNVMRTGFRARSVVVAAVFRKSLRLTHNGRRGFTTGKINNLMTTDAEMLQQICQVLHGLWSAPVRVFGSVFLLYQQLGVSSSLLGAVLLLLMFPVQTFVIKRSQRYTREGLQCTDRRIGLMNEILAGMDIVKCYVWEDSFKKKVGEVRKDEIGWFRKAQILGALNTLLLSGVPILVAVTAFGLYVFIGGNLTPAKAFTSLSLFAILRFPLHMFPNLITQTVNANVALTRLQDLLVAEERLLEDNPPLVGGLPAVSIRNGTFSWDPDAEKPTLSAVDLDVPTGSFVAVVGATGEGKTSILSAILGEIPAAAGSTGEVALRGRVAYVPQVSWIFNATVRDNVLFGAPFDAVRYNEAIRVSALEQDLGSFPAGDLTEIGERGVNISGGQKQRVSIARAVYADADVYIFDDPLSALDAHVAKEVFDSCMKEHLHGKTVILATNQLHFLAHVDKIFLVRKGVIEEQGTFEELLASGPVFQALMENAGSLEDTVIDEVTDGEDHAGQDKSAGGDSQNNVRGSRKEQQIKDANTTKAKSMLTTTEEREKGVISVKVLQRYYTAMGGVWVLVILFGLYVAAEVNRLLTSTWLSIWTDETKSTAHSANYYNGIYALFSFGQVLITLMNTFWLVFSSLTAAQRLHNGMLDAILRAPMSFFHSNPLGRVINRFAKDTGDIDRTVLIISNMFLTFLFQLFSTFILIGIVSSLSLWAVMPLLISFYTAYVYFQATAREVKRLDSVSRSPVYAQFSEALNGLATIRAFKAHGRLAETNGAAMDNNIRFTLLTMSANRWLSIRLEFLGGVMILITAVLAVLGNSRAADQAALASQMGLLLSYALNITNLMTAVLRLASAAENSFNAVERVGTYTDITPEAPAVIEDNRPVASWPKAGNVEFNQVVMRYRPHLPAVLNQVSFIVKPHEKIGIAGRTGAGKTSLTNALFRIVEIERGQIVIDNIDISKIGLADLRKKLGIIPQFPVPFSGSIRFNLDPFNQHSDVEIWEALERAHLKEVVRRSSSGLDMMVSERGENFSVGQRQLLSLARALLRRSQVLVLDEATAAVDVATDVLIQKTIRDEFKSCTMLIIAHRLNTIIDSDRVLVMDGGEVVEFDSPQNLLANEDSKFAGMVRSTGAANARYLQQQIL